MYKHPKKRLWTWFSSLVFSSLLFPAFAQAEEGVTDSEIIIGGVMDLEGRSSGLGMGMKIGIDAAIKDKTVGGKKIVFKTLNDSYTPDKTVEAVKTLMNEGVLLFAGNMGTPTAKVSLPLLAEKKIPAVGFYTGAEFLRKTDADILNFRASYAQETKSIVLEALKRGIPAQSICTFAQSDAFGMEGVKGVRDALATAPDTSKIVEALDKVISMEGVNNVGPIGVYKRNTFIAREGYDSLKAWEKQNNTQCKLVVTVAVYEPAARFMTYSLEKGEPWVFSAISASSAEDFMDVLQKFKSTNAKVMMTQVTPSTDSTLPIVQEAHTALGDKYGYVTQEGYIVGRLLLYGFDKLVSENKPITRSNFMAAIKGSKFDLGGLTMDFTTDNQGSDFIAITTLENGKWASIQDATWAAWFK